MFLGSLVDYSDMVRENTKRKYERKKTVINETRRKKIALESTHGQILNFKQFMRV